MLDLIPFRRIGSPDLFKEMEGLTRHFWEGFPFRDPTIGAEADWTPNLDITETGKTVEVKAELPGMERKDIDITLDGDLLVTKRKRERGNPSNSCAAYSNLGKGVAVTPGLIQNRTRRQKNSLTQ
jgi:HSP20 family molecular chaperone IbpA